jgi:arylsulfatase A-like enzyme
MLGLAHRGWSLNDYREHIVHPLRSARYSSVLIGEQHISEDPAVIGYDEMIEVDSHHAQDVAPITIEALQTASEPFFFSVGFFETHRQFRAPTSVRDSLYSLPPANLPDTPATRRDMAAFKASARSLDQGIGAVLNGLHDLDLTERTLIICTTDHGLAFPNAKATLYDRGTGVMLLMRGPGGFTGGKVYDAMVSHLDIYPTLCDIAGAERPDFLQGTSLLPLVTDQTDRIHDEIFTEVTFHAAYEPTRAIRTERWKYIRRFDDNRHPVLSNADDSASKEILVEAGWADQIVDTEQLYDLILDPNEVRNLAEEPGHAKVVEELRERLTSWMRETEDPLLDGPVPVPPGAVVNEPTQVSPNDPLQTGTPA